MTTLVVVSRFSFPFASLRSVKAVTSREWMRVLVFDVLWYRFAPVPDAFQIDCYNPVVVGCDTILYWFLTLYYW